MNSAHLRKWLVHFFILSILGIHEIVGYSVNSSVATANFERNRTQAENCCRSDQFQCLSGQCISLEDKCNGQPNCEDKSDETKETCLNIYCPAFTFKCGYGACVNGYGVCNGIRDCVDNSDEDADHCGTTPPTSTTNTTIQPPTVNDGGCKLPSFPENGRWNLRGGASVQPGQNVSENEILVYSCKTGYKLSSGGKLVACLKGGWSAEHPTCLRVCPALYTTDISKVQCFDRDNIEIKCDEATDDSSAKFTCATYYEPPDKQVSIRHCWSGTWNLPPPQCIPVCGEKRISAEPLIVNGQVAKKGNYPWVTAIYRKIDGVIINVCGGSLMTQKVIITAAHCVAGQYGNAVAPEEVIVGVGKYYNKYKDERDTLAQYSEVAKVIVHPRYKGDIQRFSSDIAFLVTKDVLFLSKVVQPVCFNGLPNIHLKLGDEGVVSGWGLTTDVGQPLQEVREVREVSVPYKDDATCNAELPSDWADKYLGYDKFCAGHYNRSIAVCKGDSGSGLVFENQRDGRFYIHGITSLSRKPANKECDIQASALYTKVTTHFEWLKRIISENSRE